MAYVTPEQRQEALLAKLLWASIGAGVDVGLTDDQLVRAIQPDHPQGCCAGPKNEARRYAAGRRQLLRKTV